MWNTVVLLIVTIIFVPLLAFIYDEPLNVQQESTMHVLLAIYSIAALLTYIVSSISKNYSQVDKLWSVIPIVYSWVVVYHSGFEDRMVLMAILVTLWGIRLSFNFGRRGGYRWKFWEGEEDYRWAVLRSKKEFKSPLRWTLFNLFFISLYQMALILLFTLPILKSMGGPELGIWDYGIAILFILFILIETLADQQQWNFHKKKEKQSGSSSDLNASYKRGFVREGLWRYMRHPNYAAEQAIWISFYLFSIVATGIWLNWSIVGCLLLIVLFKSSSDFSEKLSAEKYPDYKAYQKQVGRFFPKFW